VWREVLWLRRLYLPSWSLWSKCSLSLDLVIYWRALGLFFFFRSSLSPDQSPTIIGPLKSDKDGNKESKQTPPSSGPFTYKYLYWAK
jgi:hypothetical protein